LDQARASWRAIKRCFLARLSPPQQLHQHALALLARDLVIFISAVSKERDSQP
jgi:hypothetical protein